MNFLSKLGPKTKVEVTTEKPSQQSNSNPWISKNSTNPVLELRHYNETLTKLYLSRNIPKLKAPTQSTSKMKQNHIKKSKVPKLTLFDGFTNAAIAARFQNQDARVAALVYCSAGMIGGQLSNSGGTHFAQEESTLIENHHIFPIIDDTLQQAHPNTPRTEYPIYRIDELTNEINNNNKEIYTPAYGYLIDNIIPLQLDGNKSCDNFQRFFQEDGTRYAINKISYIMQAAIHLGMTHEDEATNYLFYTNPCIKTKKDLTTARTLAMRIGQHFDKKDADKKYPNLHTTPDVANGDSDAFNAFSTHAHSRLGLRYALKTLLFSNYDFITQQIDPDAIFDHYNANYDAIETQYLNGLRTQLINQMHLTQIANKNILITGVFGCGVYNNDWTQIAKIYGEVIADYGSHLDEVIICNKLSPMNTNGMNQFVQLLADTLAARINSH